MVVLDGDTGDELEERGVLLTELVIESFGNPLDVESFASATGHVDDRQRFFLGKAEGNRLKLLDERFAVLASMKGVLSAGGRLSRLTFNPLPGLCRSIFVEVKNEMFVHRFGNLPLDLAASGVIGNLSAGARLAAKRDHTLLLRNRDQIEHLAVDGNIQPVGMAVPTQLFDKKFSEVERLDVFSDAIRIEHLRSVLGCRGQAERADDSWFLSLLFLLDHAESPFITQSHDELSEILIGDAATQLTV